MLGMATDNVQMGPRPNPLLSRAGLVVSWLALGRVIGYAFQDFNPFWFQGGFGS